MKKSCFLLLQLFFISSIIFLSVLSIHAQKVMSGQILRNKDNHTGLSSDEYISFAKEQIAISKKISKLNAKGKNTDNLDKYFSNRDKVIYELDKIDENEKLLINKYDRNGDGVVTSNEILNGIGGQKLSGKKRTGNVFKMKKSVWAEKESDYTHRRRIEQLKKHRQRINEGDLNADGIMNKGEVK